MTRAGALAVVSLLTACGLWCAESPLEQQTRAIAARAQGKVSAACSLPGTRLSCDLNPHGRPPMQSVFKAPLAAAVLDKLERGAVPLDQTIRFLPSDRFVTHTYSPLQDKYPQADVDVPLRELMRLAVMLSDNAAADILLRYLGGPQVLTRYMEGLGIAGFHQQDNEHGLQNEVQAQYGNWFEPAAAVQFLERLSGNSPLSPEHTRQLVQWMTESTTGPNRLRAGLPLGTAIAHKTGTSGVDAGLAHATNDIGLITLPDGRKLTVAVFVTDSTADEATRESIIAEIARAAYRAAVALR